MESINKQPISLNIIVPVFIIWNSAVSMHNTVNDSIIVTEISGHYTRLGKTTALKIDRIRWWHKMCSYIT